MADGTVGLIPDSTGKKVDVSELTRLDSANTVVERQRMVAADDANTNVYGLAEVRDKKIQTGSPEQRLLHSIDDTLKQIAFMLEAALK